MPSEPMNITIPPQAARFIRNKVARGETPALTANAPTDGNDIAQIRASVRKGLDDIEQGCVEEFDEDGQRKYFAGITERGKRRLDSNKAR